MPAEQRRAGGGTLRNMPLVLAEVPNWVPLLVAAIGLLGGVFGVVGALMVQRTAARQQAVSDRYRTLRDTYASFVATAHTLVALAKALHQVNLKYGRSIRLLLQPFDAMTDAAKREVQREAAQFRDRSASLNTSLAQTVHRMHRSFAQLFILDQSAKRREAVRERYDVIRGVHAAYCQAQENEVDALPIRLLEDIEEWLVEVGRELSREEGAALSDLFGWD